jgi:glutathione peroxidase
MGGTTMSIYDFKAEIIDGEEISLDQYKGKVLIIVNTASKCGLTPQYEGLEDIYKKYKDQGLEILGFPCNQFAEQEPGGNEEVKNFCTINYGVTFQLFKKIDVRGENAHPLFKYLTEKVPFKGFDMSHPRAERITENVTVRFPNLIEGDSIKWNFTKFLVDRSGKVVARFEPTTEPVDMIPEIEKLL